MPVRHRSGSSPLQDPYNLNNGPSLLVTSPSVPPENRGTRRGSVGAVEAVKQRARRDTTTSSDLSSENEPDPAVFRRQKIKPARAAKPSQMLSERIQEEEKEGSDSDEDLEDDDVGEASDLSDEFEVTAGSTSLLSQVALGGAGPLNSSPRVDLPNIPPAITPQNASPKKSGKAPPALPSLPPGRPISFIQPVSALTMAIKAKNKKPESPFERFATLSGKGDPKPLYIKICAPFSNEPTKPYEVLLRRTSSEGVPVAVADAIGFALWRYAEEGLEPPIKGKQMNTNRWTLRMVEDGEVDFDFPALGRTRPVVDFTSNNNRPPRGRSRDKPWDEFALVEATEEQFEENESLTPSFSTEASASTVQDDDTTLNEEPSRPEARKSSVAPPASTPFVPKGNPITGPSFAPSAIRKDSALLDVPTAPTSHATPRTGVPKTLTIHHTDPNTFHTQSIFIPATTDTYLAEVFDTVCKRLHVDKGLHLLKVSGTNTVAPSDRTVEALGDRKDLDLARRRFAGDIGAGASLPASESPNAPLLLTSAGTPKRGKKLGIGVLYPHRDPSFLTTLAVVGGGVGIGSGTYKRYAVIRKQPMSFTPSHPRVLALDGEYMHVMPAETGGGAGKTSSVPFSSIVGCKVSRKHPRMFRVLVFREKETKRYDFEAASKEEAAAIVAEIRKGVEEVGKGGMSGGGMGVGGWG
ncbi:hypothetical protein LTR04_003791 [Oleoguttula sp. CCFEE 6159]|nr:hypothetical protein LTR04_003791 [Oleoguttula sp. CCFEE 6159]